jgi:hypothetical protein
MSLLVYLEDPPVVSNVASTGLSKAVAPLLDILKFQKCRFIAYQSHSYQRRLDLDFDQNQLIYSNNYLYFIFDRLARRFPFWLARIYLFITALLIAISLRSHPSQSSPYKTLFAILGSDLFSLIRAHMLSKLIRLNLECYLVDDILAHPSFARQTRAAKYYIAIVNNCNRVYCITDGLKQSISAYYKGSIAILPLGYKPNNVPMLSNYATSALISDTIVYIGSINHLYIQGIRDLITIVKLLHSDIGIKLRLISTYSNLCNLELGEKLPDFLSYGQVSDSELAELVHNSLFSFIPYSFDSKDKHMVSTSFPSKLIPSLQYSRQILIYSPEYSTSYQLFSKYNASHVATNRSELVKSIKLIHANKNKPDSRLRYVQILAHEFSSGTILKRLESTLLSDH